MATIHPFHRLPSPLNGPQAVLFGSKRGLSGMPPMWMAALLVAGTGLLAGGCGDDEPGTPPLEEGLQELQGFAAGAANSTEGLVLQAPAIEALLTQFGLSFDGGPLPAPARLHEFGRGGVALSGRALAPRIQLEGFGTYRRAPADTTGPFRGWVLDQAGVPPDGFVFRFLITDDIVIIEEGNERHLAGEIRFLEIVVDENNTPDPLDDVLTHVKFEIQIVGETPDPLVRIEYTATLDTNREPETITVGDEAKLSASYIGSISFALLLNGTGDDLVGLVQLVDTSLNPNYVVRLGVTAINISPEEVPESAAFTFGYGRTSNPLTPPWTIVATFDNFRQDQQTLEVIADVEGGISYNERLVATFQGDTTQVPVNVDTDDDGDVDADDTCVNVNITRVGSPQSQNICEALGALVAMLPFQQGDGGFRLPFSE